jgi:hypothetical protein
VRFAKKLGYVAAREDLKGADKFSEEDREQGSQEKAHNNGL